MKNNWDREEIDAQRLPRVCSFIAQENYTFIWFRFISWLSKRKKYTVEETHLKLNRSVIIIQPINYLLYKHKLQQLKEQKTLPLLVHINLIFPLLNCFYISTLFSWENRTNGQKLFYFLSYEEHEEKLSLCFGWPLGSRHHLKAL